MMMLRLLPSVLVKGLHAIVELRATCLLVRGQTRKDLLNLYFAADGRVVSKSMREQMELNERAQRQLRANACEALSLWWYDSGFPFNAANWASFQEAIDAIGQHGPNMKAPSYHELRVPLLRNAVEETRLMLQLHEKEWDQTGCTLMADGWKDRRERSIINFLVNSNKGTLFLESIDASDYSKTGEKLFELFSEKVEFIGKHRVIQVVTDSTANMKLAGAKLMEKYPTLYWTPCAAHCLDLMLEDIFKTSSLKTTHEKAVKLTSYIYNRPGLVNMLRKATGNVELLRPAKTRFATAYICLSRIHQLKKELRKMFTSEVWVESKWAKEAEGKNITAFILQDTFWTNIIFALKVAAPLVEVLRLVDGEKRPPMGYIYEAMDRAKECIARSFQGKDHLYRRIFTIIDHRWNTQLHQDFHAAGNYLNPEYFYKENFDPTGEAFDGLMTCVVKMYPSENDQDQISHELDLYRHAGGSFGKAWAIRQQTTKAPGDWWGLYGKSAPLLQVFAKKVLNLTCSSSGCERNFSIFENLHTKRRNRLEQQRLNDLVFVKYNRALARRYELRDKLDPISLEQIDEASEFLTGASDEEDADEGLTWGDVATASGANEPTRRLRSNSTTPTLILEMKKRAAARNEHIGSSRRTSVRIIDAEDEEEHDEANTVSRETSASIDYVMNEFDKL